MMGSKEESNVGPLAALFEAASKVLELMRSSGPLMGKPYKDWQATADALDVAMGRARPLANEEPVGRGCVGCSAPLEDLADLGAQLLRMAEGMEPFQGSELEQAACHVAGFCSAACWVGNAPESFPGGTAVASKGYMR